eukprot:TRINITY_DN417_c0_g1_i1.p1 TRINITY_DN417_c0_g1~~TRINITY_DN417_c0_g1_i1.p1  ORF type:complete len:166 (-),score=12.83 TRINITY_DN417_c0_g1_i1:172-669(-)
MAEEEDIVWRRKIFALIRKNKPQYFEGDVLGYEITYPKDIYDENYRFDAPKLPNGYTARVEMKVQKKHLSFAGLTAHGGVVASLADSTIGVAIFQQLKRGFLCSSIEFKVHHIAPIREGDHLVAYGVITHMGKSIIIAESIVQNKETNVIVSRVMGTYNCYHAKM